MSSTLVIICLLVLSIGMLTVLLWQNHKNGSDQPTSTANRPVKAVAEPQPNNSSTRRYRVV
jgi:Flp pilus assembly protein CpaB